MLTRGEYRTETESYGLIVSSNKLSTEVVVVAEGRVYSAFKADGAGEHSFNNYKAKDVYKLIKTAIKGCTSKNGQGAPFVKGTLSRHTFKKMKMEFTVERFNGELVGAEIRGDEAYVYLEYTDNDAIMPASIPYIKLTQQKEFVNGVTDVDSVAVRTLEEIYLSGKNFAWLKGKKYYIVNDDETAEKIFKALDNFNGPVSFDVETSGLRINMFGKINSKEAKQLADYNLSVPDEEKIRVDYLVGVVLCVEENVSYYFPVANKKFTNLYEDKESTIRKQTIDKIKWDANKRDPHNETDMGRLLSSAKHDELTPDVILMERLRHILETRHIVAHGGAFEWRVCWLYEIDVNLKDDTMILHQVLFKFRSTTSNRGESSKLKDIEKREFGIDSLELHDFFPDYAEDESGTVKSSSGRKSRKKKGSSIDFSYMDYDGARAYAPADGDWTLQIYFKYKRFLIENHKELEYLYNVEVMVSCAIGYMEFYGHRIDEEKIANVRKATLRRMVEIEYEIRQLANMQSTDERSIYESLKNKIEIVNKFVGDKKSADYVAMLEDIDETVTLLKNTMDGNVVHQLNLASPAQVSNLFYVTMGIPFKGEKMSVAKNQVKHLTKMKDEDGNIKYPIVGLYSEWKKLDTLITKFFDNLPDFMYPGGFIFSGYGQIAAATGRMNSYKPNAQQYPKEVTKIIVPRKDCLFIDADYSQIEYRVLVALAREPGLLEKFNDPDSDYHTMMASLMYDVPYASVTAQMRSDAKGFNFGIPYGMGFKSLAILLTGMNGPSQVEEAKEKYELYFKDQPNVRRFFDDIKEMALVNKFTKTFWNRYRYYSFTDKDGNESNMHKAMALRQSGNAVIQGTAADIFKIAIARLFMYIRRNKLHGMFFITNLIHDEILTEVNSVKLNPQRVLRDMTECMQFKVKDFPPLFIGAGFGMNWSDAKGKMAEIHPHLNDILGNEANTMELLNSNPQTPEEALRYFDERVFKFRRDKIINYLLDEKNHGSDLHPAIGSIINLQFLYGLDKQGYSGDELTMKALENFILEHDLGVSADLFRSNSALLAVQAEEEDEGYEDEDEEDLIEIADNEFALIDEDDSLYGVALHDVIKIFGLLISKDRRVCGIDTRILPYYKKDDLVEYLTQHQCQEDDPDGMQVIFLKENNVLFETGVWVKNIEGSEVSSRLRLNSLA